MEQNVNEKKTSGISVYTVEGLCKAVTKRLVI